MICEKPQLYRDLIGIVGVWAFLGAIVRAFAGSGIRVGVIPVEKSSIN